MGTDNFSETSDEASFRRHTARVLEDLRALERMVSTGMLESRPIRIGAEQEMFLVEPNMVPARSALRILEHLEGQPFTKELGLFNLEANLSPQEFTGSGLRDMESELLQLLDAARGAAAAEDTEIVLAGILPTLEEADLQIEAMTPSPRYRRLNDLLRRLRGDDFRTFIRGQDLLEMTSNNVMLEACNTSFQVHLQVDPVDFPVLYNLAQLVAAPVLAVAANSPLLLGRRLWHETRIALLQQSLDTRVQVSGRYVPRQRVSFGERWVERSVIELFREDLARFQILMTLPEREAPEAALDRGECPPLEALALHNGTVYRWNRPCYGSVDGVGHLRIENRILPAGPTPRDEIANAAFFLGLVTGLKDELGDPAKRLDFEIARTNFHAAARYGLGARFEWLDGQLVEASQLVLDLLPAARRGLEMRGVDEGDIQTYLEVIEERARSRRTGAQWVLDRLAEHSDPRSSAASRSVARQMLEMQRSHKALHEWDVPVGDPARRDPESARTIGRIMATDLITIRAEDSVELAANVMDWRHLRHLPVEDGAGRLVGLLTHRGLLRLLAQQGRRELPTLAVREVMVSDPLTVTPETPTLEALALMRSNHLGCLPVVKDQHLVGLVTARDFVELSASLLDDWLPPATREPRD